MAMADITTDTTTARVGVTEIEMIGIAGIMAFIEAGMSAIITVGAGITNGAGPKFAGTGTIIG
jgi:hypothetical protein